MKTELKVELLAVTPNAEALVAAAMKQCTTSGYAAEFFDSFKGPFVGWETVHKFILSVLSSGHESPIEHVAFTFAISGVSRALSHQLVRHRIASYSQQSQRYVDANGFYYIMPPYIEAIPEARKLFVEEMERINATYEMLQIILREHGYEKTANEDARFVLPNACETRLVFTMNARELLHFFSLRCCNRAQWEIRNMAMLCLEQAEAAVPVLFQNAGPRCVLLGKCPEGARSCGKMWQRPSETTKES